MSVAGTVWVVVTLVRDPNSAELGSIQDLEVLNEEPTFSPTPWQKIYKADINGGDAELWSREWTAWYDDVNDPKPFATGTEDEMKHKARFEMNHGQHPYVEDRYGNQFAWNPKLEEWRAIF
jgi:hypothetical protein